MLADFIGDLGLPVDGPYNSFADAMSAALTHDLSAAVLDVNVGGQKIYPLAEHLLRRSIPFVFVTGYGADGVDPRFAHVPLLEKPVDMEVLRAALAAPARDVAGAGRDHAAGPGTAPYPDGVEVKALCS
jgi:DNA-binding response OmpR family regulator